MAKMEKLIPIIIKWEANIDYQKDENIGLTNRELFEKAVPKGYGNDPVDKGGPTMVGVTIATYTEYCLRKKKPVPSVKELKSITYEEWLDILKTMFWDKMRADEIHNQSIANLCVNTVWGSGPKYIKNIQGVVGVMCDGIVGPITLKAINENPHQDYLFQRLWNRRKKFFQDIVARDIARYEEKIGRKATEEELLEHTKKKFLNGWLNRLNDFKFEE